MCYCSLFTKTLGLAYGPNNCIAEEPNFDKHNAAVQILHIIYVLSCVVGNARGQARHAQPAHVCMCIHVYLIYLLEHLYPSKCSKSQVYGT